MKRMIPVLLMTLALAGCAMPARQGKANGYISIPMEEAAARMAQESGYILLDVRTQEEYDDGHIPGALLLPNETIGFQQSDLLPDKEQLIFVYCRSGNRSKQAAAKLAQMGYTNIVEIGGIGSWKGEIVVE